MSEVETVIDAYKILKEYIPAKDIQMACDHFVEDMQEVLDEQDLYKLGGVDKYLKSSVTDLIGEEDFELEEDEY
tara:strand:- start:444 stop:665 length:222 start_codon:yes stop_codon:yes gene_type:complete